MMEFTFWAKDTNNFLKFLVDSNFDRNLFDIDDCEKFMSFFSEIYQWRWLEESGLVPKSLL